MATATPAPVYYPVLQEEAGSIVVSSPWLRWFSNLGESTLRATSDITVLSASLGALALRVGAAETDIIAAETDIDNLQLDIDNLEEDITAIYETIAQLQEDFEVVEDVFNAGYTGTVTLAKITGGGTDGSLTVVNGLITAVTAPT